MAVFFEESPTGAAVKLPTANKLYGPFLVGSCLQCVLYGITVMQFYVYFNTSQKDPKWLRIMIFCILVLETAATGFSVALIYEPLILLFGEKSVFQNSPKFLNPDAAITSLIATPIQLFMAWRIRVLTENVIIPACIAVLAFTALAGGFWTTVSVSLKPHYREFESFRAAPATWLISSAVADIAITLSLVVILIRKKSGFSRTDNYLNHLILVTVQTGTFTAVAALADVVLFLSVPGTTVYFIWNLSLSKLYTSSILSSLNTRNSPKHPNALFINNPKGSTSSHSITNPSAIQAIELGSPRRTYQEQKSFVDISDETVRIGHSYGGNDDGGIKVTREVVAYT